jgi:hypothetical protein
MTGNRIFQQTAKRGLPPATKNGSNLTAAPVRVGALKPVFSSTLHLIEPDRSIIGKIFIFS